MVKVIRAGKGVFEMCLGPDCKTKENWKSRREGAIKAKEGIAAVKEVEKPKGRAAKKTAAPRKAAAKKVAKVAARAKTKGAKKEAI
jgi:hypothetical protein